MKKFKTEEKNIKVQNSFRWDGVFSLFRSGGGGGGGISSLFPLWHHHCWCDQALWQASRARPSRTCWSKRRRAWHACSASCSECTTTRVAGTTGPRWRASCWSKYFCWLRLVENWVRFWVCSRFPARMLQLVCGASIHSCSCFVASGDE